MVEWGNSQQIFECQRNSSFGRMIVNFSGSNWILVKLSSTINYRNKGSTSPAVGSLLHACFAYDDIAAYFMLCINQKQNAGNRSDSEAKVKQKHGSKSIVHKEKAQKQNRNMFGAKRKQIHNNKNTCTKPHSARPFCRTANFREFGNEITSNILICVDRLQTEQVRKFKFRCHTVYFCLFYCSVWSVT